MRQRIKKIWFYATWFLRYSLLTFFYLIISFPLRFNKKYKNLWLISERLDEARDNGYWLYKWILENKPEINVRYVLSRDSVDYKKMPRKDLIIEPNSAQHYIAHILSTRSISTHMHGACPGKSFCIPYLPFMRRKKTVFLQHGIIKDSLNLRGRLDAVIASAKEEKEIIAKANRRYANKIFVTGLCRYDTLVDESSNENIVLVMPTFRKWLRDLGRVKNSDDLFMQTGYYKKWMGFINNKKLDDELKKNNARMIFFPHREMQLLARNFKSDSKNIKIGKPGEYDVQELLKKAKILITDYSSVIFDFVYMDKPVVFYQFDQKDFFSKHYSSSGKEYPFGNTCVNEDNVVDDVIKIMRRKYVMEPKYKRMADDFYAFRDTCNCERNFNIIKDLK